MNLLTIDFETYYDREYSLKKMTMVEYIMDARFQPIMLSYAFNDDPVQNVIGYANIKAFLDTVDWGNTVVNAQNCVTGDHEVLTPNGWVRFDALRDDQLVMQWDTATGIGTFVKPNFVVRKPYNGVMYESDTLYHKGVYTPNHRCVFQTPNTQKVWRFETAEQIASRQPNGVYFPVAYEYEVEKPLHIDEPLIRFIEAVRADGYVDPKTFSISFHFSKQRKIQRLYWLAEQLNIDVRSRYDIKSNSTQLRCYGDVVFRVKELLGHRKTLCKDWVSSLSLQSRRWWVDEIKYWDGRAGSTNTITVYSAKKEEVEILEWLAQSAGFQVKARYDLPNNRGWSKSDGVLHFLCIRKTTRCKLVKRPTPIDFNGIVYCVNVPTGAFVVRRKGISWITGNCAYDASILSLRFGKFARAYIDTMAMARTTGAHVVAGGASLEKIGNLLIELGYPIPPKGHEVATAQGKHLYDMYGTPYLAEGAITDVEQRKQAEQLLQAYVQYCNNDVELARQAYKYFRTILPKSEIAFGDMILKCYIQPQFYLDLKIIQDEIVRIENRDKERLQEMADQYFGGSVDAMRTCMRSSPKFTAFLKSLGGELAHLVEEQDAENYPFLIPTKHSEKKGKWEACYSKSYAPMMEMANRDDWVGKIFYTKLLLTSSIEMTRAKTFEAVAKLGVGFGIAYQVSGAHTHRLSGGSGKDSGKGTNPQNLSSGRKEGQSNALKRSITARDGYTTVCLDSSQIELRTGGYISSDENTLELFRQKKDPYSVQASLIYGGDPDEIKRLAKSGVEPYSNIQRPVAKSNLLSCIYGTGAGGFQNYLKTNGLDIDLDECVRLVQVYRQTHPEVVRTWKHCETALNRMLAGGNGYFGGPKGDLFYYDGARQLHGKTVAGIRLPDGNWINYYGLHIAQRTMLDGSVKPNFAYWGQKEGRIQLLYTYPSKVFENCIAEDTEVMTDRGWVKIQDIKASDLIYDGVEFVTHKGLLFKSTQSCVNIDGVYMTKDHEVLTNDGWKQANLLLSARETSSIQRLNWATFWYACCKRTTQHRREKMEMGFPVRLWQHVYKDWDTLQKRCADGESVELWLYNTETDKHEKHQTRELTPPDVRSMEVYESSLHKPETQSLAQLWSKGYISMSGMARKLRGFCTRYATYLQRGIGFRQNRQQWRLSKGELPLGNEGAKLCKQTQINSYSRRRRITNLNSVWQEIWTKSNNNSVQIRSRGNNARTCNETEFQKQVYDIKDCGKRHRFVVRGETGPFIVHNCNQAVAFAVMKHQAMLINKRYRIAGNTHDEWFVTVPEAEAEEAFKYMEWCMRQVPEWAEGLPLDCEGSYAKHYGDCK